MTGNIAFMFMCMVLVFFMTPGLALFYSGMVRRKNVLNTMLFCLAMIGIGVLLWITIGYSLSFGEDHWGVIGDLQNFFLKDIVVNPNIDETMPEIVDVLFLMMFAIVSPAIILGSLAERMKFSKMMLFAIAWSLLVYYPLSHMAWGGGIMEEMGALDFAGGNVIHVSTGISGLVACTILGRRNGYEAMTYHPHNIPQFTLGAAILWVGWFGFNCGCAGGANGIALLAFCNTAVSSAASMIMWMLIEYFVRKKCTIMGAVTGGIVGLVGITPGAGYVPIWAALIIGLTTAPICYFAISKLKRWGGYDDALDAFGCHGIGGIWGGIATGIFATEKVNDSISNNGLVYGESKLFLVQIVSIIISIALASVMTIIIMLILKKFGGIRVTDMQEAQGLDITEHGEEAYHAFNGLD